ncbi:hypothetical protein T4B_12718 [Trichinella pseudospiralis]|uniref:Uncharacterized protein n=1 Tax=Trichinella pseudospiralis TaxID=6337 RepID=A0A0V1H1Q2_TRIPS|nr:hypothetical protein T4A_6049 [Trichinella pseudospiralis]KRY73931.1 hypothetical protein T4A_10439 [Trichinella pseudospiralis]KRZ04433.1 hypothetical protein T4B_9158 [Trichinella pseudospiralis]KRZ07217.1 hypothetical protein T4B_12718 [Trichinella pseudospiralis]
MAFGPPWISLLHNMVRRVPLRPSIDGDKTEQRQRPPASFQDSATANRDLSSTKTYGLSLPTITNCSNLSNTGSELVSSVEGRIQTASISQNCPMSGLLSFNG